MQFLAQKEQNRYLHPLNFELEKIQRKTLKKMKRNENLIFLSLV